MTMTTLARVWDHLNWIQMPNLHDFECNEPLCHVTEKEFEDTPVASPLKDFITSTLKSLAFGRWESESQKRTLSWSQKTDSVVRDPTLADAGCDHSELPDTFWMDMCSTIKSGDTSQVVNLARNTERNHISNAIYRENCIADEVGDMCCKERVL